MKRLLLIVLPLLLIVGCSKPINESSLVDRSGVKYQQDSDKPYTGEVFSNYDTGEKLYQGTYENGLLLNYSYLNEDGSVKEPIDDSTLIKKGGLMYSPDSDKPYIGEVFTNYDNGEKEYQGTYENGLLVSYSFLNKDGSVKEPVNGETLIDRSGLMYEVNGQKPYTGDVFELFENGNRKYSGRLKGGKINGLWTSWYENGQKEEEITYKEGELDGKWTSWDRNGQKKVEETYKNGRLDLSTLSAERLMELSQFELDQNKAEYAIYALDELINNHPEDRLASSAQYKIASIYKNWRNDPANFIKSLEKTVNNYPNSLHAKQAKKEIASFQDWIINNAETLRKRKLTSESINNLIYLVENFPQHELASKAQYIVGDIYMNDLRDFEKALFEYKVVLSNYDGSKEEPLAEFMIGYIYANILKDFKEANKTYQNFLKRFPNHELAPSVKFELDFIGKNINEIPALKHIF